MAIKFLTKEKLSILYKTFRQVTEEYLLPSKISNTTFLTDDGSENYGEAKKWILQNDNPKINHVVAQVDIHFSNSMIEAANKQLKYRFLYNQKIANYKQLLTYLPLAIQDFNNRLIMSLVVFLPLKY